MLERTSYHYGKYAAEKGRPDSSTVDLDFCMWALETLDQMELPEDEYGDTFEHMIDCWDNGYNDYKNGKII